MSNSRAILTINPSENLLLTLQSASGVGLQWHLTRGTGQNRLGNFTVQTVPVGLINCFNNEGNLVMFLEGIPSHPGAEFPFLMEDQQDPPASGELIIRGQNMPLDRGTYRWTVYHVTPSRNVQAAR